MTPLASLTALFDVDLFGLAISFICLSTAFALGTAIGLERQWRQRTAGLRTNVLVAVGAAAFADLGLRVAGVDGGVRVISYVVSGIGFLGAGVIMKEGTHIRGLNTAATLWASAAVGCFAGARKPAEAVLVAGFVLAGNTLLRPLVDAVNRRPMNPDETEALYRVHVVCPSGMVSAARDLLFDELETHHYPIREMETLAEGETQVELAAILVPTTADPADLDAITAHIARHEGISSATWTVSATN
ncbi:MgtC/SapB family protein [Novosphingobium capsulatum]|uniref:MgtC/SapB family protein n=1 Tax=Novosphingobium capsulatum TaxID=13688 RepID=UPI000A741EB4|nr:MgtC/SapB family protein [Novosphingobium capsulatum]WQD94698.1 MgtC/SapB family protein [Novosphingobium capsulatum]